MQGTDERKEIVNNDLVSIIVPVYKTAEFLPRCIESLLDQDYDNIEIIMVNDGSPDDSAAIIERYRENNPDKIVLINKENQGAGEARNTGIDNAKGEWLCFVDSDDYVERDYVSAMLRAATERDADIAVSNLFLEKENGRKIIFPLAFIKPVISGEKAAKKSLDLLSIPNFAWNKLYKRSLLSTNNFRFPSIYFEDVAVAAKVLSEADKVAFTNRPLYHYIQRDSGQVGTFNEKKLKEALEAISMVGEFLKQSGKMDDWFRAWKQMLLHVKVQFTTQVMVQMKDKTFAEKSKLLKDLNEELKNIDRKYRYESD